MPGTSTTDRVLDALLDGPWSTQEIAQTIGRGYAQVESTLLSLQQERRVVLNRGRWSLRGAYPEADDRVREPMPSDLETPLQPRHAVLSTSERVLEALGSGTQSTTQVAHKTGLDFYLVNRVLVALEKNHDVVFEDGRWRLAVASGSTNMDRTQAMKARVLDYLTEYGPARVEDIAMRWDARPDNVVHALRLLEDAGKVEAGPHGRWALVRKEPTPLRKALEALVTAWEAEKAQDERWAASSPHHDTKSACLASQRTRHHLEALRKVLSEHGEAL